MKKENTEIRIVENTEKLKGNNNIYKTGAIIAFINNAKKRRELLSQRLWLVFLSMQI